VPTRIPASERTSQKLDELLSQGVADGDARAELLKLAVRKIVEEALEAEVADAVGRDYFCASRRISVVVLPVPGGPIRMTLRSTGSLNTSP
jgi:hypothetical protein